MEQRKPTLDYIQALRALAAIMVVMCHARDFLKGSQYEGLAHNLFWPGAFGVDLFFIISGFIIVYTSYDYSSGDVLKFVKKRFMRVWPLYFVFTLIYIAAVKFINTNGMQGFSYNPLISAFDLLNVIKSLAFIPLNLDSPVYFGTATLFVGWTLNYEIYFYSVCAIGLLFSNRKYWFYGFWFAVTLLIIPAHLGAFNKYRPMVEGVGYINLMMQPLVWEFVFGAIIAIMYKKDMFNIEKARFAIPMIFFAIAIPACMYATRYNADHGITHSGMYYCIMFFMLTSCHKYIANKIRFPKIILLTGNASYSLYLSHPISFILSFKIKQYLFPQWNSASFSFMGMAVLFSLAISFLSYHFIEKKMSRIYR